MLASHNVGLSGLFFNDYEPAQYRKANTTYPVPGSLDTDIELDDLSHLKDKSPRPSRSDTDSEHSTGSEPASESSSSQGSTLSQEQFLEDLQRRVREALERNPPPPKPKDTFNVVDLSSGSNRRVQSTGRSHTQSASTNQHSLDDKSSTPRRRCTFLSTGVVHNGECTPGFWPPPGLANGNGRVYSRTW
jgi:hypothetical protein